MTLATDLADSTDPTKGAALVGFRPVNAYARHTAGWGVKMAQGMRNLLEWISDINEHAAIVAGTSTLDVSSEVQAAIDELYTAGGGDLWLPGLFLCNTPIVLKDKVRLWSNGVGGLKKDSTTTKAVNVVAGGLVVYGGAALPSNINAILVLDGGGGRYTGGLHGVRLLGTLTSQSNHESQKVEFGVVSIGSVSSFTMERCHIEGVQYAAMFPIIFVSRLEGNLFQSCLRGLSIDNGTSTPILANYANSCRDWGYFLRDLKYSLVASNACDSLNRPDWYPTRTRTCAAYRLRSTIGVVVRGNGDEQTCGRSYEFNEFDRSSCEWNVTIGLGSDYVGTDDIAWLYSTNIMRGSRVANNFAYDLKSTGLYGPGNVANPSKHHNIYFEGTTYVSALEFRNNLVGAQRNSTTESGYLNNTFSEWLTGSVACDPALLSDGAGQTVTVSVPGAGTGDFVQASFSLDLQGITLTAWVSSANTVSVRFQNESGGALNLASGTLRARVTKAPL